MSENYLVVFDYVYCTPEVAIPPTPTIPTTFEYTEIFAKRAERRGMFPSNPATRKFNYETAVSNFTSIELSAFEWEFEFPEYQFDWVLNFDFNFLINLDLSLDLSLDFDLLMEFRDFYIELGFDFEYLEKAVFDETKYEYSYCDPPNLEPRDLIKFAYTIRKKYLDKVGYDYKYTQDAMKKILDSERTVIERMGLDRNVAEYIVRRILISEAKLKSLSYVGFGIVGIMPVASPVENGEGVGRITCRDPDEFEPTIQAETISPYESHVGFMMVGYSRVSPPPEELYVIKGSDENRATVPIEVADTLKENIDNGRMELGVIEIPTEQGTLTIMPARSYMHRSAEQKALKGGKHQAMMQNVILFVSKVCNKYGIVGHERITYQNFANELKYYRHRGVRKAKTYKDDADVNSIVDKYVKLGCNRNVLIEIAKYVVPYTEKFI